jgi:hypothetical protein
VSDGDSSFIRLFTCPLGQHLEQLIAWRFWSVVRPLRMSVPP